MMIGMMAPSVAPTILTYARVGREGNVEGKPLAATGWFATGYFLTWIGFALAATLIQWMIERAGLLDSQMASASNGARLRTSVSPDARARSIFLRATAAFLLRICSEIRLLIHDARSH